jgi:hypothetical protein
LAQRVLEAVFGDQAVRRLAETAKDDLDGRVQALMSAELLRYHAVLDALAVRSEHADRVRAAVRAVQQSRAGGLPAVGQDDPAHGGSARPEPALVAAREPLAIEAPIVSQVAYDADPNGEIIEAELLDRPRPDRR